MSAISDNDIIGRLAKLSIAHPEVLEHAPVTGVNDWKAELVKLGKGDVAITKTVRACALAFPLPALVPSDLKPPQAMLADHTAPLQAPYG